MKKPSLSKNSAGGLSRTGWTRFLIRIWWSQRGVSAWWDLVCCPPLTNWTCSLDEEQYLFTRVSLPLGDLLVIQLQSDKYLMSFSCLGPPSNPLGWVRHSAWTQWRGWDNYCQLDFSPRKEYSRRPWHEWMLILHFKLTSGWPIFYTISNLWYFLSYWSTHRLQCLPRNVAFQDMFLTCV